MAIKPALKHSKLRKYYDQVCNFNNNIPNKDDDLFDTVDGKRRAGSHT